MRPPSVYANPPCPGIARAELHGLLRGPWRVAARGLMILLSLRGWPPAAIADLFGVDPVTVRRWIHRYQQHGTAGLADRPRHGGRAWAARRSASGSADCWISRAWTIPRRWQYLGRPAMSLRTLHRRTREVAAWRRPRLVAKGDPDAEQLLADLRQQLSELPEGAIVLADDETHLNLLPWVQATWIARGQRQRVMTPGKNQRRTIFGAVDLASGRFIYLVARKAVSVNFMALLEQVAAAWPDAPVIAVVCDNVIIHHSKLVQRWLAAHPRVRCCTGARQPP